MQYARSNPGYPRRVKETSEHVDPMSYPLLYGDTAGFGWHCYMQHAENARTQTRTRLTAREYYAHYLMRRDAPDDPARNPLPHGAGRLFQQWVVDAYCKTEGQRLDFLRFNQKQLRADNYSNEGF